ncbi:MAG: chemotaxis protein CheR [Comamonadaceae bacterium CG_4_9_14_3_um_filter_60_33]|nr:MAG: chemotaxis protein CheR [Comamonadaceae bacterium CG_4_10_14_3_um_filter_60_42]PJB40692.1 MAG: chemotaxis protein CheR [Comamonadaceae bacterium CG_4_9_14_3_um_filter_60_33]
MNLVPNVAVNSSVRPDFLLTDSDFLKIRTLIHQRAGIALSEHKRQMVYSRLARRLRKLKLTDFSTYLGLLQNDPRGAEWQLFVNALTTNLTAFFREPHHFPLLAEHARRCGPAMTVWCSAASTGEEPYSIAMTLIETLGSRASQARVVATDIDTHVLELGAEGIFSAEQVSKLSPERLKRFFLKGAGDHAGEARIRPEVAAMVTFAQLNLLAPSWTLKEPFDAIFCRNVMIYFDRETQENILRKFVPLLKPHGLLFAGHSENFSSTHLPLRLLGKTVYELISQHARAAA